MNTITPKHLRAFRKNYGLTQQAAADLYGTSRVTWVRWEGDKAPIPKHMGHTLRGMALTLQEGEKK